ncbi:hypothetical protein ACE14D_12705 [Streptomyces sp. Act-28]
MSSRLEHPTDTTGAHRAQHRAPRGGRAVAQHPPARYEPYLDGLFTYCLSVLCDHDAATAVLGEALAVAERQHGRCPADPPHGRQSPPPYGHQPTPPYAEPRGHEGHDEPERRRSSKLPLVAVVVVGCAVVGLGAGALMSGGGEAPDEGDKAGVVAASSQVPGRTSSSEPAPDPVKAQAEQLDKLLADSNDSRDAVIRSVENIKLCRQLDKAAADLREAAGQRRELVNRLRGIEIDKLPDHAELSSSLIEAWQASATADDHYAAWAQQVENPKNCKDGRARNTGSTSKAAVASGEATEAKRRAARLWNGVAETYGLTKRQPTQL